MDIRSRPCINPLMRYRNGPRLWPRGGYRRTGQKPESEAAISKHLRIAALAVALALPAAAEAATLRVSFSWAGTAACSTTPPAFTIADIPKDTKTLDFSLHDLDAPHYVHGGGEVAYSGSGQIPPGAFDGGYNGPCPPSGATHTYVWTVRALDAARKVLAQGKATGRFPPPQ